MAEGVVLRPPTLDDAGPVAEVLNAERVVSAAATTWTSARCAAGGRSRRRSTASGTSSWRCGKAGSSATATSATRRTTAACSGSTCAVTRWTRCSPSSSARARERRAPSGVVRAVARRARRRVRGAPRAAWLPADPDVLPDDDRPRLRDARAELARGSPARERRPRAWTSRCCTTCAQRSFADHWGFTRRATRSGCTGSATIADSTRPSASLAEHDGDPPGSRICRVRGARGRRRPAGSSCSASGRNGAARARHRASRHRVRSLCRRGLTRGGLGVDAENTTGAVRLYERAGMTVAERQDSGSSAREHPPRPVPGLPDAHGGRVRRRVRVPQLWGRDSRPASCGCRAPGARAARRWPRRRRSRCGTRRRRSSPRTASRRRRP